MEEFTYYQKDLNLTKKYIEGLDFDLPIRIQNILKEETFSSEKDFYQKLQNLLFMYTSVYLFPNELCAFYPRVLEYKARTKKTCHLSGAIINPNQSYYCYRPILENLNTKQVYTITKTIICSYGYQDLFPQTLFEFEEWCQKLSENNYHWDDKIDFYAFSSIIGDHALCLKELKHHSTKKKQKTFFIS